MTRSTSEPAVSDSTVESPRRVAAEPLLSIAAVERETGLGKDTLRAWERRYGFPRPQRDASGIRGYPRPMVERLALIRRALLAGQRPGRLLGLPPAQLEAVLARVAAEPAPAAATARAPVLDIDAGLAALRAGPEALRDWLTRGLARTGLAAFVVDGVVPLTVAVGDAWAGGRLAVYEEHLFTEAVQAVLRSALVPFQSGLAMRPPRLLLTTLPGEAHGLGLLMAEALFTLDACRCLMLGTQTPVAEIVAAVRSQRADVVALSFSESFPAARAAADLGALRAALPAPVAVWAGGGSTALRAVRVPGIRVMGGLVDISEAVAQWRSNSSATVD